LAAAKWLGYWLLASAIGYWLLASAIGLAAAKWLWLGLALAKWLGYLAWLRLSGFDWLWLVA